ncbi:hypothetical protein VBSAUS713_10 [Staphylococcus phage vB_SauS_713]|nr:hypothetical protein VBSAUS713_10 [Staphylococcus phage vB_SauS_713]
MNVAILANPAIDHAVVKYSNGIRTIAKTVKHNTANR